MPIDWRENVELATSIRCGAIIQKPVQATSSVVLAQGHKVIASRPEFTLLNNVYGIMIYVIFKQGRK